MELEYFTVTCISTAYDDDGRCLEHLYTIGNTYQAASYYERQLIANNDYLEYEWVVNCSEHNHYQFTHRDFKKYFIDTATQRALKIKSILDP